VFLKRVRVTELGDFSPIGRLLKVGGNFFKEINSPKKRRFFGRILDLSKIAQIYLIKATILVPKSHFSYIFHEKFTTFSQF
jgi:hypothetical protein